jgi:catechol 2,3-dioxygenase-like lactoylglutathione lyase family enzyme
VIDGAHVVIYSANAEADRAFVRDVLGFPSVDAGHGWLIFSLPRAEAALHPSAENGPSELYFMCPDLKNEMEALRAKGTQFTDIVEARWGTITRIRLPGGGHIGLYQPKHARP